MSCSEWINLGLLLITLVALVTVWIQPRRARAREKEDQVDQVKKRGSLYLDVFEIKVEQELSIIYKGGIARVGIEGFEKPNQRNYQALEDLLQEAGMLERDDYMELMEFVRDFKISPPMKYKKDLVQFLDRIKNKKLREVFPEGRGLEEAIKEAIKEAKQPG